MFSSRFLLCFAASLAGLLGGCATAPTTASDDDYQPPASGVPAAFLKGSRVTEGGLFGDVHTGYVYMIDLKSVRDAAGGWDKPITLAPGKRTIMAQYHYSNFKARATLILNAREGVTYQLMIKHGRENTADLRLYCEFWIAEVSTGKPVTPVQRAQVMGGKKGTIFNVPT